MLGFTRFLCKKALNLVSDEHLADVGIAIELAFALSLFPCILKKRIRIRPRQRLRHNLDTIGSKTGYAGLHILFLYIAIIIFE